MEAREWTFIARQTFGQPWPSGPWDSEPDKAQWADPETGLPCIIRRNWNSGNLCGYVGVATGHPLFGVDYSDSYDKANLEVHGGLTFSDFCSEEGEHGICHTPGPNEPDHVWWFGFDCAHAGDSMPGMMGSFMPGEYRDFAYVKRECASLAQQLANLKEI